ncbi:acyltransferase [Eubacterium sp. MSJ-33]|uniref:acyltransferase n=1 Tax=Eubacterium sp. MSJ-33 TaxID=2841528 RepID=UPI001C78E762|nr:acyltransferase [Eubacterium sp. MSJ-33]QWT52210.1 acyltransferase [Eubacterium sp. MSJ-33]
MGKLKDVIGCILHPQRIIYRNCYSNDVFINYLKSKGAQIGDETRFIAPQNCRIDPGRLDYIKIGKNCCISSATILAHDYSWYVFATKYNDILPDPGGNVTIGNNVFVGYDSCILKDTTIGDNVIIGAKSVVKGSIPSNTVWAGVPAKQIYTLEEFYNKRIKDRIPDAIKRRDHIIKTKKRKPTIEEMGFFSLLFLERNEQNYKAYIMNLEFNGVKGSEKIKNIFFHSTPIYKNFDAFLNGVDE